jgi:hypothetical protein
VTFGGVIISLTAAVVFFFALRIAAGVAAQIARYIDSVQKIEDVVFPKDVRIFRSSEALRLIRELSFRWVTIVAVVGVFLCSTVTYFGAILFGYKNPHLLALGVAVYFLFTTFVLWKRQAIWWFAALVTIVCYVLAIVTMFNADRYGQFLRFVGYGGGLPVKIELEVPDADNKTSYETSLVLRTTDALIVFDEPEDKIREFQLDDVRSVTYQARPLTSLKIVLPLKRRVEDDEDPVSQGVEVTNQGAGDEQTHAPEPAVGPVLDGESSPPAR